MITLPFHAWIATGRQLRRVYASNTLQHTLHLQHRHPFEIVALPSNTDWKDVMREELWFPKVCATAGFFNPLCSFDIVQHTPCSRLLVGNILIEFHAESMDIVSHEEVLVYRE